MSGRKLATRPVDVPMPTFSEQTGDPLQPLQTIEQQEMFWVLENHGHFGLYKWLINYATKMQAREPNVKSWPELLKSENSGEYDIAIMLYSFPTYVLKSLIRNTLPFDMINDQRIRNFVLTEMKASDDYAGVYCNIISNNSKYKQGGIFSTDVINPNRGKWLTGAEIERFVVSWSTYVQYNAAGNAEKLIMDHAMPAKGQRVKEANDPDDRRYKCLNQDEYIRAIRNLYLTGNTDKTTAFARVPMEVGESYNLTLRLNEHKLNTSTNALFGYSNAWSKRPENKHLQQNPQQLLLLPMWKWDQDLFGLGEIVMSIICSSYWNQAGYNPTPAGGKKWRLDKKINQNSPYWANGYKRIFNRPHMQPLVTAEYQKKQEILATLNDIASIDKLERERDSLVTHLQQMQKMVADKKAEAERLGSLADKLKRELSLLKEEDDDD